MKKNLIYFLFGVIVLFASCNSKKAIDFNDKLVKIQKEVVIKVQAMMAGSDISTNKKDIVKVNDYIKSKLKELEGIEAVSGGEAFKQAMIDDIELISKICDVALKMQEAKTNEEITELTEKQRELTMKANSYDSRVIEEQRKFAKAKGFKVRY